MSTDNGERERMDWWQKPHGERSAGVLYARRATGGATIPKLRQASLPQWRHSVDDLREDFRAHVFARNDKPAYPAPSISASTSSHSRISRAISSVSPRRSACSAPTSSGPAVS